MIELKKVSSTRCADAVAGARSTSTAAASSGLRIRKVEQCGDAGVNVVARTCEFCARTERAWRTYSLTAVRRARMARASKVPKGGGAMRKSIGGLAAILVLGITSAAYGHPSENRSET